jgi:hypothetical protein
MWIASNPAFEVRKFGTWSNDHFCIASRILERTSTACHVPQDTYVRNLELDGEIFPPILRYITR